MGKPVYLTLMGQTLSVRAWAHKYNIGQSVLWKRLKRGMTLQEALFMKTDPREKLVETDIGPLTAKQLARVAKVTVDCIHARLRRNCHNLAAPNMKRKKIEAFGKIQTIPQWSKETGLSKRVIWRRVEAGWAAEQALSTPLLSMGSKRNAVTVTAFGKTKTLCQWAKETGIHPATLRHRVRIGMPAEMALTIKPAKRGKKSERRISNHI